LDLVKNKLARYRAERGKNYQKEDNECSTPVGAPLYFQGKMKRKIAEKKVWGWEIKHRKGWLKIRADNLGL